METASEEQDTQVESDKHGMKRRRGVKGKL